MAFHLPEPSMGMIIRQKKKKDLDKLLYENCWKIGSVISDLCDIKVLSRNWKLQILMKKLHVTER